MSSWGRRAMAALLAFACMGAAFTPAWAVSEADLLPVDQAFALTASASAANQIELRWKIADGYYLYRQRIGVQADPEFHAVALQLPQGAKHHDEFFGDVQTYRRELLAILPGAAERGIASVTLKVKYQGCADIGVCYPPQLRTLTVALPVAKPAAPAADGGLSALQHALGGNVAPLSTSTPGTDAQPLPPDQAFGFEAIVDDASTLLLRFTPAKGYYLYRDKTTLRVSGADGIRADAPRWPPGVQHRDEHFGNVVVYFDQVDVPLPLLRQSSRAQDITVTATFQGCQTDGICYPPMTRSVALQVPAAQITAAPANDDAMPAGATSVAPGTPSAVAAAIATDVAPAGDALRDTTTPAAEDTRLATALAGTNRWLTLLGFFGAGLLLAFTPCVLPMIPILSGLIAGQGTRLGTGRALLLSLVYVVANALVFTAAGVVAGLLGANLQAAFQTPWIITAFAAEAAPTGASAGAAGNCNATERVIGG